MFIFLLLFTPILFYFTMPVLSFLFPGIWIFVWFILMIPAIFQIFYNLSYYSDSQKLSRIGIFVVYSIILLCLGIAHSPLFRADSFYRQISIDKKGQTFSSEFEVIDTSNIRIGDAETATVIGNKVIGQENSLGSQVEVGEYTLQNVKGQLYWIAPLLHSGLFKYTSNSEGTIGYVQVSATNSEDFKLVTKVNGHDIKIKYQPNAYFGNNLERHLYFNGYMMTGMTDYTFEVDDEGNPYWVVTLYKPTIGFRGSKAYGVLVVNPESGKIEEYAIEDAPKWIDRIQPQRFVESYLEDWGTYPNGFWNFSHKDMKKITSHETGKSHISFVYANDGNCYWYSGVTSYGTDNSTMGFVLVNSRTLETKFYHIAGATESAAIGAATGKYPEKHYHPTSPILYNIVGVPTYIISLKNKGGLVEMIAMVSVENHNIVGIGTNIEKALISYKDELHSKGNVLAPESKSSKNTLTAQVDRINVDIQNGNSRYYFSLKGSNKLFLVSSNISPKVVLTKSNDTITISFDTTEDGIAYVSNFENTNIAMIRSEKQTKKENENEKIIQDKQVLQDNKNVDAQYESLTPQEKQKLFEKK